MNYIDEDSEFDSKTNLFLYSLKSLIEANALKALKQKLIRDCFSNNLD